MERAIILTSPRTGSNYLLSLLNSHPAIHFHGEIFHREKVMSFRGGSKLSKEQDLDLNALRKKDPDHFVELAFGCPRNRDLRCRGYKHFLDHDRHVLSKLIARKDVGLIVLERKNRLASYSSKLIAKRTGAWKSRDMVQEPGVQLFFDAAEFATYCRTLDRKWNEVHRKLEGRTRVFNVEYDTIASESVQRSVVEFLVGGAYYPLSSTLSKQNTDCPIDRFANKQDVLSYLTDLGRLDWAEYG